MPYEQRSASPASAFATPAFGHGESSLMVRLEMGERGEAGQGLGIGSYFPPTLEGEPGSHHSVDGSEVSKASH